MDYLCIVYPVAAGRSIAKYIRVPNQQKAKGTPSGGRVLYPTTTGRYNRYNNWWVSEYGMD